MKGKAISLYPFYHFHPLHRDLDISWVIAAESSHLRTTGSRNRTWKVWYTLFRIYSTLVWSDLIALVLAVVRRMLKTRVTMENISRVLLSLFKRLMFVMFKGSSSPLPLPPAPPLNVPAVSIHVFSLVHQLLLLLTLPFVPLPYLFGVRHDMYIQFSRVCLRDF